MLKEEAHCEDLNRICLLLNIDAETSGEARLLLGDFIKNPVFFANPHIDLKQWSACSLYVASHQLPTKVGCASLSSILRVIDLSLFDFFNPLQTFMSGLGKDLGLVSELKQKYVTLNLLFASYNLLYDKHFKKMEGHSDPNTKIHRFGWSLFLVAKARLQDPSDFISCFHLQLCCFHLLLVNMPTALRLSPLDKLIANFEFSDDQALGTRNLYDTLLYVCESNKANYQEVHKMGTTLFIPLLHEFSTGVGQNPILKVDSLGPDVSNALHDKCIFVGLLDTHLIYNEKSINQQCDLLNYDKCDINGRLFLESNNQLLSPMRQKDTHNKNQKGSGRDRQSKSSDLWLKETFDNIPTGPSNELKTYFQLEKDMTADVAQCLEGWIELVSQIPVEVKVRASKFFYRYLLLVLKSEEKRLEASEFKRRQARVLQEPFLRPLFAICVEVVLSVHYYVSPFQFPWILGGLDIVAADFPRFIECLIWLEQSLPAKIVKHLTSIEEQILETHGWVSASPIFRGNTTEQKALMLERISSAGTAKHLLEHAYIAVASSTSTVVGSSTTAGVDFFFRKAINLGCLRINALWNVLCETPEIDIRVLLQAEYSFAYLLTQKTELFRDRHIDQIILCIFYGLCRVHKIKQSFQNLAQTYIKNFGKQILKDVLINPETKELGDIITFYNKVFMGQFELSSFFLEFDGATICQNINPSFNSPQHWQPSTPKIKNFFLTPLKGTANFTQNPQSGRGTEKILLSPNASPQKSFRRINSSMRTSKVKKELFPNENQPQTPDPNDLRSEIGGPLGPGAPGGFPPMYNAGGLGGVPNYVPPMKQYNFQVQQGGPSVNVPPPMPVDTKTPGLSSSNPNIPPSGLSGGLAPNLMTGPHPGHGPHSGHPPMGPHGSHPGHAKLTPGGQGPFPFNSNPPSFSPSFAAFQSKFGPMGGFPGQFGQNFGQFQTATFAKDRPVSSVGPLLRPPGHNIPPGGPGDPTGRPPMYGAPRQDGGIPTTSPARPPPPHESWSDSIKPKQEGPGGLGPGNLGLGGPGIGGWSTSTEAIKMLRDKQAQSSNALAETLKPKVPPQQHQGPPEGPGGSTSWGNDLNGQQQQTKQEGSSSTEQQQIPQEEGGETTNI